MNFTQIAVRIKRAKLQITSIVRNVCQFNDLIRMMKDIIYRIKLYMCTLSDVIKNLTNRIKLNQQEIQFQWY